MNSKTLSRLEALEAEAQLCSGPIDPLSAALYEFYREGGEDELQRMAANLDALEGIA